MSSDVGSGTKRRPDTPKWDRKWPHDQPAGWNLDAARLLMLVQSAGGMMWLGLGRAKYLELRVDTRDGAFNLYDRDGQPLNPDDVVEAVEKAISNYGPFDAPASSPAENSNSLREALDREEKYLHNLLLDDEIGGAMMPGDIQGAFHRLRNALSATERADG